MARSINRDKEYYFIMIKRTDHQEVPTIAYTDVPNSRVSNKLKQILAEIKGESEECIVMVGNVKTSVSLKGT